MKKTPFFSFHNTFMPINCPSIQTWNFALNTFISRLEIQNLYRLHVTRPAPAWASGLLSAPAGPCSTPWAWLGHAPSSSCSPACISLCWEPSPFSSSAPPKLRGPTHLPAWQPRAELPISCCQYKCCSSKPSLPTTHSLVCAAR